MSMFCNQCEQAARGVGCNTMGVCGKQESTSILLDLLQYQLNGIGVLGKMLRKKGISDEKTDFFILEGLFTLVTNVNFDDERIKKLIKEAAKLKNSLLQRLQDVEKDLDLSILPDAVIFEHDIDSEIPEELKALISINSEKNENLRSIKQLLLYGIRGMSAYAYHAWTLGERDEEVIAFFYEALSAIVDPAISFDSILQMCIKCGTVNIRCMEILNIGHTKRFGDPEPTEVFTGTRNGPAIIVSGHDLLDLEILLKQTEGTGINIYTHGEMLPAHGYPGLKKYKHLAGHFGTAWQNQQREFDGIKAAILFTTNCIQKPRESYIDKVFTTGPVGWPGVTHITNKNFSPVIDKALELKGLTEKPGQKITTGFGHKAVLSVADKVISGVKAGKIRHFFLIGGCDGAKPGRNYYTEFAQSVPNDCIILTLACGKFRFNNLEFGTLEGIPRLLDVGQCNDAYSAIKIASALAEAFNCSVNDLPLSLVLSWYEQKAVVILLSLLSLGIKGIRIGPSLPAFLSPDILNYLVTNFNLKPIGKFNEDLNNILSR